MPLAKAGKAGGRGAQTFGVPYPQAGRPARAKEEPADGVFRDRGTGGDAFSGPCPFRLLKGRDDRHAVCLHHLQGWGTGA